jgi:hypothetical protein
MSKEKEADDVISRILRMFVRFSCRSINNANQ